MSYQRSTLKLTFEDPEFVGLEIKAKRLSIGDFLKLSEYRSIREDSSFDEQLAAVTELVATADKYLIAWNMTEGEEETPVPCSLSGMDPEFVLSVIEALCSASARPSRPLSQTSDGGAPSEEELIPMETYSGDPVV